jgi:6-phosphogluconate dehydrogenase
LAEVAVQLDCLEARERKQDAQAVRRLFGAHKHNHTAMEGTLAQRWSTHSKVHA